MTTKIKEYSINGNTYWVSEEMEQAEMKASDSFFLYHVLFYEKSHDKIREERKKNKRDLVWAIIKRGNKRQTVWYDRKTGRFYKNDNYNPTWMEIKRFKFIRFATTFDL